MKYITDIRSVVDVMNKLLKSNNISLKIQFDKSQNRVGNRRRSSADHENLEFTHQQSYLEVDKEIAENWNNSPHNDSPEMMDVYNPRGEQIGALKLLSDVSVLLSPEFLLSEEVIRILESSYDGLWITDGKGKVLYTNSANERLTGIKREDVLGKMTQDLMSKKLFSLSATLEVMSTHKRVTIMGYNYKTSKQVLITGNPIFDRNGELAYIVNNIRDITEFDNLRNALKDKDRIIDQQKNELEKLRNSERNFDKNYIFRSGVMCDVFELTQRVGRFDLNVLILGESGAGKEIVADSIVSASDRRDKPFIKVNCGAIPESLLESELFGYERGAFTGANQKGKIGMFELANGGTILLDEVADIPLNLQVKMLRAIQNKEIMRLGGTKSIHLDVRILAATNKNLEELVKEGQFREDLFYRLNVVGITVPPLRDRKEDIPALIRHFLKKFTEKHHVEKSIESNVLELLCDYSWPGNVRELENLLENLVVLTREPVVSSKDIPDKIIKSVKGEQFSIEVHSIMPLKDAVSFVEDQLVEMAMHEYGTTRKAARVLGVDQSTIVRKLNKS